MATQSEATAAVTPTTEMATSSISMDLRGTVSVVVGASVGIGQAIAVSLAEAGSQVVGAARQLSRLDETTAMAVAAGGEAHAGTVDVTSPESIRDFAADVVDRYGPPTVLVNSAGVMVPKAALEITVDEWDLLHDTQLRGPFLTCQAFGPAMAERGYGKIINLSSTWAFTVRPGRSAYCAAKAGLSHLTAALACEWAPLGIRVNAIAPTATRTPAAERRIASEPDREARLKSLIPLGDLATTRNIADAALFLASPASDFITGETIMVDGGWRTAK